MDLDPVSLANEAVTDAVRHGLLLVDDDPVFSRVLARALSSRGFDVTVATDCSSALRFVYDGNESPSFVILDLNLGGESGLQLVEPIRRGAPDCRILVLTGYASITTAVSAIKLGADEYLAKPIDADSIVRALRTNDVIDPAPVPEDQLSVPRLEWEHIQRVLAEYDGNISATARALRMHRRTLQRKLAKHPARD